LLQLIFGAILALLLFGPAQAQPTAPTPPSTALALYGQLPVVDHMSLSRSGKRFAFVMQKGKTRQLFIRDAEGGALMTPSLGDVKVRGVRWAGDDIVLVAISTTIKSGKSIHYRGAAHYEIMEIFIFDVKEQKISHVFQTMKQFFQMVTVDYGERLIDGRWYGFYVPNDGVLYRVNLESGQVVRVAEPSMYGAGWLISSSGTIVAHEEDVESYHKWRLLSGASGGSVIAENASLDSNLVSTRGLGRTQSTALVLNGGGGQDRVLEYNLVENSTPTQLFNGRNVETLLYDPDQYTLIGAIMENGSSQFFDPILQSRFNGVLKAFPGLRVTPVSFTAGFGRMIVLTEGNGDSGTYWLVDLTTGKASELTDRYPEIPPEAVAPVSTIRYSASDGLPIEGILTLPRNASAHDLPLIVMPHGGPIGIRDVIGFDWWAQAFASRGYAVLQPNYRGSGGYGPAFRAASHGQWGRKMQTDISDGVAALAQKGVIDPRRVCIVGASYGGYAALAGVTLQQGVYRCAVSVGGVSDQGELMADYNTSSSDIGRFFRAELGVDFAGDANLARFSPLFHAAEAAAPILLIYGEDDTVVDPKQSLSMKGALDKNGKLSELVKLDGEDHWLSRSATREAVVMKSVAFVERFNPPGATAAP
jgi:dipeptidyl aminopeptidase/acylaminoacyl peptidase